MLETIIPPYRIFVKATYNDIINFLLYCGKIALDKRANLCYNSSCKEDWACRLGRIWVWENRSSSDDTTAFWQELTRMPEQMTKEVQDE